MVEILHAPEVTECYYPRVIARVWGVGMKTAQETCNAKMTDEPLRLFDSLGVLLLQITRIQLDYVSDNCRCMLFDVCVV